MNNLRRELTVVLCVVIGCMMILITGCATGNNLKIGSYTRIDKVPTREKVTVELTIYEPKDMQKAKGIALLFPGASGGGSFSSTQADKFAEQGYVAIVMGVPSDIWSLQVKQRWSMDYQGDIKTVIDYLKSRYKQKSLYLLGNSAGAISVIVYNMFHRGTSDISGIVLMSMAYDDLIKSGQINLFTTLPFSVLLVQHEEVFCQANGLSSNLQYYDLLEAKGRKGLFIVKGGNQTGSMGACDPKGPHGFGGREKEVVKAIVEWMDGVNGMDAKEVKRIIK